MDALTLDQGDGITVQTPADQAVQGRRQGVALVDEELADVGGGQAPQVIPGPFEAADPWVGGCASDAVEL
jgi:hypothetical protein